MFNRLFRGSSQVIHRTDLQEEREQRARDAFELVADRLHRLEISSKELRAELDAQAVAIHKLRGRITGGIRYEQQPGSVDDIPQGDRVALRKLAGIRPGQPFSHK